MLFPIIMCVLITQVYSIGKNVLMLYQFSNMFFTYLLILWLCRRHALVTPVAPFGILFG